MQGAYRVLLLSVLSAATSSAAGLNTSITQADTSKCPVVTLNVTVTDATGNPVSGLGAGNFTLTEDGQARQVTVTQIGGGGGGTPGLSIALVLDWTSSINTAGYSAPLQSAARAFVDSLPAGIPAGLWLINGSAQQLQSFTTDHNLLDQQIGSLSTGYPHAAGSPILDTVLMTIGNFTTTRRAVVVFSDGQDYDSKNTESYVVQQAKQNNVAVYTIEFDKGVDSKADQIMQDMAAETGGKYFTSASSADLAAIFQSIQSTLTTGSAVQYLVTYTSADGGVSNHNVSLTVTSGGSSSPAATTTVSSCAPPPAGSVSVGVAETTSTQPSSTSCSTPPPVSSFAPTAPAVYLYFLLKNLGPQNQVYVNWIDPSGNSYQKSNFQPVASVDNWCFSDVIAVAGKPPASRPGSWTVQIVVDSKVVATVPFTIAAPTPPTAGSVSLEAPVTSNVQPSGAMCVAPPSVSTFSPSAPNVYLYFVLDNLSPSNQIATNWIDPSGNSYMKNSYQSVDSTANWCFSDVMAIAGNPSASKPGNWTVQILVDGKVLGTAPFLITGSSLNVAVNNADISKCPTITLTVSVTDGAGNSVAGLGPGNFTLTEDGQPRSITVTPTRNQYLITYTSGAGAAGHSVSLTVTSGGITSPAVKQTLAPCATTSGDGLVLTIQDTTGAAGQAVNVPITLTANGTKPAGYQLDVSYDPTLLTFNSVSNGSSLTAAGKNAQSSQLSASVIRVVGAGLNQNVIGDGPVCLMNFTLASSFPSNSATTLSCSNPGATDPQGGKINARCAAGMVRVKAACTCDLNGDGAVTIADVQLMVNQVLGLAPSTCGPVNIQDVQIVVNAVLGQACAR